MVKPKPIPGSLVSVDLKSTLSINKRPIGSALAKSEDKRFKLDQVSLRGQETIALKMKRKNDLLSQRIITEIIVTVSIICFKKVSYNICSFLIFGPSEKSSLFLLHYKTIKATPSSTSSSSKSD